MIITKLIGGLGNQMFQYAAGEALARKLNTNHKLDISDYKYFDDRQFDLGYFSFKDTIATKFELFRYRIRDKFPFSKIGVLTTNIERLLGITYYKDKTNGFQKNIFDLQGDIYLDGYWQSEKYFSSIEKLLKNIFTFSSRIDKSNSDTLFKIKSSNSVSIHIRRGDYVEKLSTNQFHGVCSLDYYHNAIKLIEKKVNDPNFFIFSDDPEWVKKNLKISYPTTYVDNNQNNAFEDMRLMSNCNNNIIANSSFSWWAAWLNKYKKKTVIAPTNWYKSKDMRFINPSLNSWIKI